MSTKKLIPLLLILWITSHNVQAQVTTLAPGYKNIVVQSYSPIGNYSRSVILLHEAYSGTLLAANHTIGVIVALRGSVTASNRINVATVNTSSAYNNTSGSVSSDYNNSDAWKLKTCLFNGKKYLALEVPYSVSYFNQGFKFTGWTVSTGENILAVPYEKDGLPVNQDVISNIEDFIPNLTEIHDVKNFNILGDVSVSNTTQNAKLEVNGNIRAREIKVENANWPDYVFEKNYQLPSLEETEKHIKEKGHLQDIPSADEVKSNGVNLGEMNAKLLKKIEELTLIMIELNKKVELQSEALTKQQAQLDQLK